VWTYLTPSVSVSRVPASSTIHTGLCHCAGNVPCRTVLARLGAVACFVLAGHTDSAVGVVLSVPCSFAGTFGHGSNRQRRARVHGTHCAHRLVCGRVPAGGTCCTAVCACFDETRELALRAIGARGMPGIAFVLAGDAADAVAARTRPARQANAGSVIDRRRRRISSDLTLRAHSGAGSRLVFACVAVYAREKVHVSIPSGRTINAFRCRGPPFAYHTGRTVTVSSRPPRFAYAEVDVTTPERRVRIRRTFLALCSVVCRVGVGWAIRTGVGCCTHDGRDFSGRARSARRIPDEVLECPGSAARALAVCQRPASSAYTGRYVAAHGQRESIGGTQQTL